MTTGCTALFAAFLLLSAAGCGGRHDPSEHGDRIVSIAPNTTEILYALDLGDRVVGVSRFCAYPPEVKDKPAVGGLYDLNWEKIAALRPALVVGLNTQQEAAGHLRQLGIPFIGVSHERIDEILAAILTIGNACGAADKADELVARLRDSSSHASSAAETPGRTPAAVLVCISRDETASRCYIAARGTFYDELIERAGGVNACMQTAPAYPEFSPEGLMSLQPDVIIDIGPTAGADAWRRYPSLPAVQTGRITVITNDYASLPGPRFVTLLADFKRAIHP